MSLSAGQQRAWNVPHGVGAALLVSAGAARWQVAVLHSASASALNIAAEAASAHATNRDGDSTLPRSELVDVFDQTWRTWCLTACDLCGHRLRRQAARSQQRQVQVRDWVARRNDYRGRRVEKRSWQPARVRYVPQRLQFWER